MEQADPRAGAERTLDTQVLTEVSADHLVGRLVEGRYEIVEPVARGGMATVYVALDRRLDREVAIKVMHASLAHDPDFVARFEREAKAAARISHPNVVAVTDTGVDGDLVFLVMELVRGRTLRELLRERGRLTPAQALEVLEPVLIALAAAQDAGLVHRDVKPENVLLGDDGAVKVADFGLARAVEASGLTTHAGLLLGTVAYLPPEQVTHGHSDGRGDVYAAGIVLFEMLTGTVPYEAETPIAVAYRHVHEDVPAPSSLVRGIPTEVDDLVLEATARDPEDRIADAAAFLAAVRRAGRQLVLSRKGDTVAIPLTEHLTEPVAVAPARRQRKPARTARTRPRRRWPYVLVVILVLSAVAAALGVWLAMPQRVTVPPLGDRSLASVEQALTAKHLPYVLGPAQNSDTIKKGLVLRLSPAAGSKVKQHATVTITPSAGILMVTVPQVDGASQADATKAIQASGLHVGTPVKSAYSDTVAAGDVISSEPAQGRTVTHTTAVMLVVSQGAAPVTIPDVTKQPQAQAQQTLTALGLKPSVSQAFSDTVAKGVVISQDPPGGTAGHRTEAVKLVVSQGPQTVAVPPLDGMTAAAATQALQAAGLVPVEQDLLGTPGTVVFQNPRAGTTVKVGTKVTFYTG